MTFLYPTFLFAIGLIAIPIIIHFFNFQRPKKVYFTNIDFLKQVKAISNSRNKLKNLLVLLARCLFITALAYNLNPNISAISFLLASPVNLEKVAASKSLISGTSGKSSAKRSSLLL
ncbi:N-terminal double-transmembrane domain-containing protein [Thermoflexibacter ruber]|uniref:N-terminal double-transmembrane domain-containing protein n=1 Tax=Thermoflexibacter ruber TaxID=1003 RepID=A0A1I2JEK7_9BACT|nr:N-terminal double-transmembrane domain-containing protein [Thermoflexibacter ruber]